MKHYFLIAVFALLSSAQSTTQVVTARAAARFLDDATWGPTPASIARVESMGFTNWLTAQYALNTSDLPDQPILNSAGKSNNNAGPVQAAFFQNAVANQHQLRQRVASALGKSTALKTAFPTTSIGQQLQQLAQIIQVQSYLGMRRQIFFCSLGGFDTHAGELEARNTLYPQLSPALLAFYNATQELGMAQNATTFTESDFSRTFQPTTTDGSDHAWGSHHLVLGGAVQGGQIFGQFPTFELGGPNDTDTRGRWIPTTSIDQYGATLCNWFGIPPTGLATVFPNLANFPTQNLGFLG